jgi:hypothetical protein
VRLHHASRWRGGIVAAWGAGAADEALAAPGLRLMNIVQAEALAKTVTELKHVVLWRGLISLTRDILRRFLS